jgi:plastocyanin
VRWFKFDYPIGPYTAELAPKYAADMEFLSGLLRAQIGGLRHPVATSWLVLMWTLFTVPSGYAAIEVLVLDRDENPVGDVAVYVKPAGAGSLPATTGLTAVMDQVDTRFVPHLLVVQTGTTVAFPNSDIIAHHVYSFSRPNQFKLALYKSGNHPTVTFDEAGVVSLGCNIHDNMLGYILVVDTPWHGKTDDQGRALIATGLSGEVEVSIWNPRIRDGSMTLVQSAMVYQSTDLRLNFQMTRKLRAPHNASSTSIPWTDY